MEKKDSINNTKSFAKGSIFSTQDLTVNTENLPPQITDAEKPAGWDNQARISSVFGQTDKTHGMDNVAFPRSGRFQGGVTEDITLPRTARKRSKLLLLLICAVLVVAVGTRALFLLRGAGGDGATSAGLSDATKLYQNLIVAGSANVEDDAAASLDNQDWFFLSLLDSDLPVNEQKQYINTLNSSFETVRASIGDDKLSDFMQTYSMLFSQIMVGVSVDIYIAELDVAYAQGGAEFAQQYATSLIKTSPLYSEDIVIAREISANVETALISELAMLKIYESQGCFKDDGIILACRQVTNSNQEYSAALERQIKAIDWLNNVVSVNGGQFKAETRYLISSIKE